MAEARESSVLFSLRQLMILEEDRLREDQEARARRAAIEAAARAEAARRARQDEEARVAAEGERRRAEDLRLREEAARLAAIDRAETVAARAEADRRGSIGRVDRDRRHEEELSRLRQDVSKRRIGRLAVACAAAVIATGGGGVWLYLGKVLPEAAAREAAHRARMADQEDEAQRLRRRLDELATRERELREKIAAVSAAPTAPPPPMAAPRTRAPVGPGRPPPPRAKAIGDCVCEHQGDPMCACLR